MYTTYHLNSPSELTNEVIEAIRTAFKGKPIEITIKEDIIQGIPEEHKKIVLDRIKNPLPTVDAFKMIEDLENE